MARKMSFETVFLVPLLVMVSLGFASLVWLGTNAMKDTAGDIFKTDMPVIAQAIAKQISESMESRFQALKAWSLLPVVQEATSATDKQAAFHDFMGATVAAMPGLGFNYANLYTTAGDRCATTIPGDVPPSNVKDRDYFQAVVNNGQPHSLAKAVFSRLTGKPSVIMSQAVRTADGKLLGMLTAVVDLKNLTEDLTAIRIGSTGSVMVFEADGTALVHPDPGQMLKTDAAKSGIIQQALQVKDRALLTDKDGRLVAVNRDPVSGWILVVMAPMEDLKTRVDSAAQRQMILAAGILLALSGVLWALSARVIRAPLRRCLEFTRAVAADDKNRKLHTDAICIELQTLAVSLENMDAAQQKSLARVAEKEALAQHQTKLAQEATQQAEEAREQALRSKAEGMLDAAGKLEGVVKALVHASDALSTQVAQSSQGAENQSRRMTETATAMEEMNATVLEVARNASEASESSDKARSKAQEGAAIVNRVVEGIDAAQRQAAALKTDMGALAAQAEGIGQILNVISDIADQTNLLALNAAIEAARAGDAGRGFAVVADEVRKLAEKTMSATKEVGQAIEGIQDGTRKNMGNVDRTSQTIEEATTMVRQSGEALDVIVAMVDHASDQVRSIATASEEQSSASEEINRSIDQVAAISTDTAQAMGQAAQAVSELARQTQVLQNLILEMKSDAAGTDADEKRNAGRTALPRA